MDDATISIGLALSIMAMVCGCLAAYVRLSMIVQRIEKMATKNEAIHSNPEKSGIGTATTNQLIKHLSELISDTREANREMSRDFRSVIAKNNEYIMASTLATQKLALAIEAMRAN